MGSPARLSATQLASGTYHHLSGLGAINIGFAGMGNVYILTVMAWCSAPGASIQLTAPVARPAIPVPPGGSVTWEPDAAVGTGGPPANLAFVGTDGYFVDWVTLD